MLVSSCNEVDITASAPLRSGKPIAFIAKRWISFEVQPCVDCRLYSELNLARFDQSSWFKLTPEIVGLVVSALARHIRRLRLNATLIGYGARLDGLAAAVSVQVVATEQAALLLAAALGLTLAQGEVLVFDSTGRTKSALDVAFVDGRPAGDLAAVLPLWAACQSVSKGRLTGWAPRRWGNLDGFSAIDTGCAWGDSNQARSWVQRAAASVGARVVVRVRPVSAVSVRNDWVRQPRGESFIRSLVAAGRWDLVVRAGDLADEVRSTLERAARQCPLPLPPAATRCRTSGRGASPARHCGACPSLSLAEVVP